MKITKKQIIKAIQTEPLQAGKFFTYSLDTVSINDTYKEAKGACKVCAVGAIIATAAPANFSLMMLHKIATWNTESYIAVYPYKVPQEIQLALNTEDYLGAISIKFEALMNDRAYILKTDSSNCNVTPGVRKKLIEFVKENLPAHITVRSHSVS